MEELQGKMPVLLFRVANFWSENFWSMTMDGGYVSMYFLAKPQMNNDIVG